MNYRHIFHAGNPCDVVKHAALALIIRYLQQKDKGFAVLDTHAGCGAYDLTDPRALKTNEAAEGIGKLWDKHTDEATLAPYLDILKAMNAEDALRHYPGSPLLARKMLRPQDRLIACEMHPEDARELRRTFREDAQAQVHERDGYAALKAFLPFPEKRGLILIDPPFEVTDEVDRMLAAVRTIKARQPSVVTVLWYPIKDRPLIWRLHEGLRETGCPDILIAEFLFRPEVRADRLNGTGLAVLNPPFTLETELTALFSALHTLLDTESPDSLIKSIIPQ